jgi:hypothetical protein
MSRPTCLLIAAPLRSKFWDYYLKRIFAAYFIDEEVIIDNKHSSQSRDFSYHDERSISQVQLIVIWAVVTPAVWRSGRLPRCAGA